MASVTGKTSEKIDQLFDETIVSGSVTQDGTFTLVKRKGTIVNAGTVSIGATFVSAAINNLGRLIFTRRNGEVLDAGQVLSKAADAWPVGSVYIGVTSTNPAELLGGGTWERFAEGRVIVGVDPTQPEFDANGETGGAKSHTLTTAEMPAHNHTTSGGVHDHHMMTSTQLGGSNYTMPKGGGGTVTDDTPQSATLPTGSGHSHTMGNTGGGTAHNNLQPYITAYIWKRTA